MALIALHAPTGVVVSKRDMARRESKKLGQVGARVGDAPGAGSVGPPSDDEVVASVVECLHAVAQARPRCHRPYKVQTHGEWRGTSLTARVESQRYGCAKTERPTLTAYFQTGRGKPVLSVRVAVEGAGWWAGLGDTTTATPAAEEKRWLRGARHSRRRRLSEQWHISPNETPPEITSFVLMLYLWRAGLLASAFERGGPGTDRAARIIGRHLRSKWRNDPGAVLAVLERLLGFGLPENWKQLRSYLARMAKAAMSDLAGRHNSGILQDVESLDALEKEDEDRIRRVTLAPRRVSSAPRVSKSTYYRWRADRLDDDAIERRKETRHQRQLAMRRLIDVESKTHEAARKFIQRALARGQSLESLAQRRGKR